MTAKSFWAGYKAKPVKESRFGIIPVGECTAHVIDIQPLLASQTFSLDDNGKITDVKSKEGFQMPFDQEVLVIVFQDEEGHVLIDRRSSTGWLHCDDKDENKALIATPEKIQQHGLRATADGRFIDRKGAGVTSTKKTESCLEIVDRFCSAVGVENPMSALNQALDIQVVAKKDNSGKDINEVRSYARAGAGFKTKATTVGAQPKAETVINQPAIAGDVDDDLPF